MFFGANCSESPVPVQRYAKFLFIEMVEIEKKTFNINNTEYKFKFLEFPNDLKMLAFLASELSLSATYFSTFGNVNTRNSSDINGTFGPASAGHTWQPWKYKDRVTVSKEVSNVKVKVQSLKGKPQREVR